MRRALRQWCFILVAVCLVAVTLMVHPHLTIAQGGPGMPGSPPLPPLRDVIVHGAHIPPIYYNNTEVHAYNQLVGKEAGIVMAFYSWDFLMPDTQCGYIDITLRRPPRPSPYDCGPQPTGPTVDTTMMLTWEPNRNPAAPYSCPLMQGGRTNLDAVINGQCDAYIDEFARRIKLLHDRDGDRFMIRLAHEMNLANSLWYQNSPGYPAKFVAFWRHVVDRFRAMGISREAAQFVWSPNYSSNPVVEWNTIPNYYPGDDYVEWIGLSGYNWYGVNGNDPNWRTFQDLYNRPDPALGGKGVLEFLHCTYAKPIVLAEIGTVDGGTPERSKAKWIKDTMQNISAYPFIKAIVWFNDYAFGSPGSADFRVTQGSSDSPDPLHYPGWHNSLGAATDEWRTALANPNVLDRVPPLETVTPTGTVCSPLPLPPELRITNRILAEPGETVGVPLIGIRLLETNYALRVEGMPGGYGSGFIPANVFQSSPVSTLRITIPGNANLATYPLRAFGDSTVNQAQSQQFYLEIIDEVSRTYLPLMSRTTPD
jgi:hypothetical protein